MKSEYKGVAAVVFSILANILKNKKQIIKLSAYVNSIKHVMKK